MQMQAIKGLRWLLFFSILVILTVCITGISFQVALARAHPFRPGQLIFPIQHFAEQARAQLIPGKTEQAAYYLDLAQQRSDDLVVLVEGEHALLAVDHLNRALDRAIEAIVERCPRS